MCKPMGHGGLDALCRYTTSAIPSQFRQRRVADMVQVNGEWRWDVLQLLLPIEVLLRIAAVTCPTSPALDDRVGWQEMQKEMVKWKAKTNERLMEFTSSLSGMQNMCKELMTWKVRVELQMPEISDSLSSL
ncbi:hypothetical protein V6N13_032401 [Hibiscus sabdariffa]